MGSGGLDWILILDFGSQYTQLIARRVRELGVYCEVRPYYSGVSRERGLRGVILSGGPRSVDERDAPRVDFGGVSGLPVLGICYGAQLLALAHGGAVSRGLSREYGRARLRVGGDGGIVSGLDGTWVWMSHGDSVSRLPEGWRCVGSTEGLGIAAFTDGGSYWGVQFHPEVSHSECGLEVLRGFVLGVCGCVASWTASSFVEESVGSLRRELGDDVVVLGLSGGVDSTVAAALLHRAIGDRLVCIFVDHGLLRKGEYEEVLSSYVGMGLNVRGVDASDRFFSALGGLTDPEQKRKAVGRCFVEEFERVASGITEARWLGQGTIYPDVIESVPVPGGAGVTIKSHHNVGGLPERMRLRVVEPLRNLFKDEVRRVGAVLGVPEGILGRHPFPGPGLSIRVLGEVTRERVRRLQEADRVYVDLLRSEGYYDKVWQAGAILLPVRSVGVMGDGRTYEEVVALRAVVSVDGMTADWYGFPPDFLARVSNGIINGVEGVNRVVYDVSSKPPATIEWE